MRWKQKGFTSVEIIGVLFTIVVVILVGVYVANKGSSKTQPASPPTVKTTTSFRDAEGVYRFDLPKSWIAAYLQTSGGTLSTDFLTLRPKTFKATGQENNWVIQITTLQFPGEFADGTTFNNFADYKQKTISQSAATQRADKEITINSVPVWQFDEIVADGSATGPPAVMGGYYDRSYIYHKSNQKVVELRMRVYQHATVNNQGKKINDAYDYSQYVPVYESIASSMKIN